MQGLMGYLPKPAFTWGNRPRFQDVALTIDASPEGCGVIIFIFWPRDNPVKYTDPDGRIPAFAVAVLKKILIDGGKGALASVVGEYASNTLERFLSGEGISSFKPQTSEFGGYGMAALRGFAQGALSGGAASLGPVKETASTGRIGSGIATAFTTMVGSGVTRVTENFATGKNISDGLGQDLLLSGGIGFLTGFYANNGIETRLASRIPSLKNNINIDGGTMFAETATEALVKGIGASAIMEMGKIVHKKYNE
jgi:hypothetical protein